MKTGLDFERRSSSEAGQPAETRGLGRDEVRMMVAWGSTGELLHTNFSFLPQFLEPGDLLVVNTSGTIPAAAEGTGSDGSRVVIHLSTRLHDEIWVVEPRRPMGHGTAPWPRDEGPTPPRNVTLAGPGARVELLEPYMNSRRLWIGHLHLPRPVLTWLAANGRPIRYHHVDRPPPLSAYQNVYATEPGSAEMPSAGRPFTPEVITRLVSKGVGFTPVVLHTGVASLEAGEDPYPERVRVPAPTALRVKTPPPGQGAG